MAEINVLAPGGNQDDVKMSSVKKCLMYVTRFSGALVPKSPLLIYANQMLSVPTTLFPGMPQTLWDATDVKQITLGKKRHFAAVLSF